MRHQKRDAQFRIVMVQFERHRHQTVAMIDGPGRNACKGAGRQGDRQRQAAGGQDLAHHRAAFVELDGDRARMLRQSIACLLREAHRVEPQRVSEPCRLCQSIAHMSFALVLP